MVELLSSLSLWPTLFWAVLMPLAVWLLNRFLNTVFGFFIGCIWEDLSPNCRVFREVWGVEIMIIGIVLGVLNTTETAIRTGMDPDVYVRPVVLIVLAGFALLLLYQQAFLKLRELLPACHAGEHGFCVRTIVIGINLTGPLLFLAALHVFIGVNH